MSNLIFSYFILKFKKIVEISEYIQKKIWKKCPPAFFKTSSPPLPLFSLTLALGQAIVDHPQRLLLLKDEIRRVILEVALGRTYGHFPSNAPYTEIATATQRDGRLSRAPISCTESAMGRSGGPRETFWPLWSERIRQILITH